MRFLFDRKSKMSQRLKLLLSTHVLTKLSIIHDLADVGSIELASTLEAIWIDPTWSCLDIVVV